jgi:hypothetical protein
MKTHKQSQGYQPNKEEFNSLQNICRKKLQGAKNPRRHGETSSIKQ